MKCLLLLLALSLYSCSKRDQSSAPPAAGISGMLPMPTPSEPKIYTYAGQYTSREIYYDPALPPYYLDTAFLDSMVVIFFDSSNIRCKLYTYTIFHSQAEPTRPGPAGRDSLVFDCRIDTPYTDLNKSVPPVKNGGLQFGQGRDSIYFYSRYHSGEPGYFHEARFAGKR